MARRIRSVCSVFSKAEAGMDGADRVVEFAQQVVGIIERAIGEDIDFGGFQDADAVQAAVQLVDEADLLPEIFDRHAARDFQALRMIGDADVFVAAVARGVGHLLDGVRRRRSRWSARAARRECPVTVTSIGQRALGRAAALRRGLREVRAR